jgi:hypothetical protein
MDYILINDPWNNAISDTSSTNFRRGRKFQIWNAYSL